MQDSPFPKFDEVKAEHVVPGIQQLLNQVSQEIDNLEQNVTASWEGLVDPLERIADRMSRAWGTVTHLKAVKDSEDLRKAYEQASQIQLHKTWYYLGSWKDSFSGNAFQDMPQILILPLFGAFLKYCKCIIYCQVYIHVTHCSLMDRGIPSRLS